MEDPLKQHKWKGASLKRRESLPLIKGEGAFGDDIKFSNLHFLGIVRSARAHARLLRIDTSATKSIPSVVTVLTFENLKDDIKPGFQMFPLPKPNSEEWSPGLKAIWKYPLATGKVRYVGEPIAVVVCKDRYSVEDALERVDVEYEPLPPILDAEEALKPGSPLLYEEFGTNAGYTYKFQNTEDPEIEREFQSADRVLSGTFRQRRQAAAPMGTRNITAMYDNLSGMLKVWEDTQQPILLRLKLSESLGIPEEKISVTVPNTGGAFGVKCFGYDESLLVPYVAYKLRKPVRWVETRMEHFMATGHARDHVHHYKVAVKNDGTILAMKDKIIFDGGAVNTWWAGWRAAAYTLPGAYKIPHLSVEVYGVLTNKTPYWPYRVMGKLEGDVAIERIVDHVAQELSLRPVEVRLGNLVKENEFPFESVTGAFLDSGSYQLAVKKALEIIDYEGFKLEQAKLKNEAKFVGFGLVICFEPTGVGGLYGRPGYEPVRLSLSPSGNIVVKTGSCSQGQAHETTMSQVIADELSVDPDSVITIEGNTIESPYGFGAFSSRFSVYTLPAAVLAAKKAREKILEIASYKLKSSVDKLTLENGEVISLNNSSQRISLSEIARIAYLGADELPYEMEPGVDVLAYYRSPTTGRQGSTKGAVNLFSTYSYAVHAATVSVDIATGQISILKYVSVHDCGTEINPKILKTQQIGCVAQGIGTALFEELVYDKDGQLLSSSFMDYLMPTFLEVPKSIHESIVSPSPNNPLGTKGGSETSMIGPPIVIAQAVEDALSSYGIVIDEIPMSLERMWSKVRSISNRAVRWTGK